MTKYGSWEGTRVVPGIAPSRYPPSPTPGTPPPGSSSTGTLPHGHDGGVNMVVGLIMVAQLTLSAQISGFQGITEVYNLVDVGIINNH